MSIFRDIVKDINDEFTTVAADGEGSAEFTGWMDTGSYSLNALFSGSIYGGIPNNKIIAFAGESSTGKTFFALSMVQKYLIDNPNGAVFYFDTEAAVTKEMMESRGIDSNRVIISEPATVQQFRHIAIQILDKYMAVKEKDRPPMMMVLDSLGQLSTTKELQDTAEGSETRDMTRAQVVRSTFRVLTLKCARARVPMVLTNHVYNAVGAYVPTKIMGGGDGPRYAASQIVFLSKKKDRDGKDVVGNIITARMDKSRITREQKKVEVRLSYDHGLDRYHGMLELAEKYGIMKKVSTRFELPDGSKVFGKSIMKDPEKYFTKEVLDQIDKAAGEEFLYGKDEQLPDDEVLEEIYNESSEEILDEQ